MTDKKKTGLLFGSFNPIHTGHLILANYMAQFTDLDQVWLVVSPQNPLKEKKSLLADYHRLALVRLALEDHPHLGVTDIEFKMPRPSYTIDTVTYLQERYPDRHFVLISGTDIFDQLQRWKNPDILLNRVAFYVYPRPGYGMGEWEHHPAVTLWEAPLMEISSSFIRKGIQLKKDMSFWMPEKVYEYIREMHFYET